MLGRALRPPLGLLALASLLRPTELAQAPRRPAGGDAVSVASCGAVADGATDNRAAILRCLHRAAASPARALRFPPGVWRSAPLMLGPPLTDGLTLELAAGATLAAMGDASDWPIRTPPCIYAPFVHITGGANLAITGAGTIDGRGRAWWDRFYANQTFGRVCDRPFLLVIDDVTNLTVRGVSLLNSASETFILNNVSSAEVSHINITAKFYPTDPQKCSGGYDPRRGCEPPNTDGVDPAGGSNDIWIHDIWIENGDDGVAVCGSSACYCCWLPVLLVLTACSCRSFCYLYLSSCCSLNAWWLCRSSRRPRASRARATSASRTST